VKQNGERQQPNETGKAETVNGSGTVTAAETQTVTAAETC